jgi:prepilin-type N-terminal cleavage/methylation domain-containing protein
VPPGISYNQAVVVWSTGSVVPRSSLVRGSWLSLSKLSQISRLDRRCAPGHASAGFTLVEVLVVVVILAVTGAVGLPAYLAQVSVARVNAANAAVMAAAKACAVAQVTENFDSNFFNTNAGVVGSCGDATANRDFTSSASLFNLTTQAVGRVESPTGVVILAQSAL